MRRLSKNWVTSYTEAINPTTEAPEQYTIWSALSVISAVLKNRVFIPWSNFQIYPNQYIVLVGPPGIGKGMSIHPAHDFVKLYNTPNLVNYISDRVTAPKIIETLAAGFQTQRVINGQIHTGKDSTACLQSMELGTLLGSSDWMTTFLCDAWDRGSYDYGTKNKGSATIKDMCISLVGGCVPEYIRKINGKQHAMEAINGGFTARTIFVFGNTKSKSLPWPIALKRTVGGQDKIDNLRHDLEQIAQLNGEYTFTPNAVRIWTKWYPTIKIRDEDTEVVRHFKSRKHIHVLKVAMCLQASHSDDLVIDEWPLKTAISLVQGVENTLDVTFRGVGESTLAEATAKVQLFIEAKGAVSKKELVRSMHRHATLEDIDRILFTLMTMGEIVEQRAGYFVHHTHKGAGANVGNAGTGTGSGSASSTP